MRPEASGAVDVPFAAEVAAGLEPEVAVGPEVAEDPEGFAEAVWAPDEPPVRPESSVINVLRMRTKARRWVGRTALE